MLCGCNLKRKLLAAISRCSKYSPLPADNWRLVMTRKIKRRSPRLPRAYTEAQLAGIKQSTTARRLATVERLRIAIDALKAKKQEISVQTIYDECGLRYAAIHRNPEALALFRANSTHLVAAKKQRKRKPRADEETTPAFGSTAASGSAEATSSHGRGQTETRGKDCGAGGEIGRVRTLSNLCDAN